MRRRLYRGLNSSYWEKRLRERGWPGDFATAFALFLTDEGPLPGWVAEEDEDEEAVEDELRELEERAK